MAKTPKTRSHAIVPPQDDRQRLTALNAEVDKAKARMRASLDRFTADKNALAEVVDERNRLFQALVDSARK